MFAKHRSQYWLAASCFAAIVAVIALGTLGVDARSSKPESETRAAMAGPMLYDFLRTAGGEVDLGRQPLAGRHFGEGAPGFGGRFAIVGQPFGPKGAFELGDADVALMRMGPTRMPEVGETVEFPVLIAAVSWRSAEPVLVQTGQGERWVEVDIRLSQRASQPHGKMTLRRDSATGGTVDFEAGALLSFRFHRDGQEYLVDSGRPGNHRGQAVLKVAGMPWTIGCAGAVRPARLTDSICIGESGGRSAAPLAIGMAPVSLQVQPARHAADRVPARLESAAFAASTAQLGGGAVVHAGSRVLDGAAIGRDAVIMPATTISAGALIGAGSRIGKNVFIGPGVYIGERVFIGPGARIEANAVIQDGAHIARGATVEEHAYLASGVQVGERARIEEGADIGSGSTIGAGATVKAGVRLFTATMIPPHQVQPINTIQCMFPDYTWVATSIRRCRGLNGAIRGYVPQVALSGFGVPLVSYTLATKQVPQSNGGGQGSQLGQDVDASGVAESNGGQPYTPTTHDCDDFADDLEQYLQDQGYNATFTCLWTANSEHEWYNWLWTPEFSSGHCMTDVHNDDGTTTWIEAQWSDAEGAVGQNLDADGDGMVGVSDGPGSDTTEGNLRIEVYGSAAEAEAAGVNLD